MTRFWPARAGAHLVLALAALLMAGCAVKPPPDQLTLTSTSFAALPGWSEDDPSAALTAFRQSCAALLAAKPTPSPLGTGTIDWQTPCAAASAESSDSAVARQFFESNFTPYIAGNNGSSDGLFTGYYEPLLRGARQPSGPYQYPLLRRPADLVAVDLGQFRPALRGERIAGRVVSGRLLPYATRAEIEGGALDPLQLAFLWVDDPVDAFFLQIQGSGQIQLPDGSLIRVGYDGQNGQPYVAVGRLLADRGALDRDHVSMQAIRAWIAANPDAGKALMDENPSYVFFRELDGSGPVGSEGVPLTPGRSLAVDRSFIPLGLPIWLDAAQDDVRIRRLLIAQDTGGAIRGPVRGDVFWGAGPEAEARAGAMKARGTYYLLLPKSPAVAATKTLSENSPPKEPRK